MRLYMCVSFVFAALCASCASVDQYGSRIHDGNTNAQFATNQEILLNILRASRYESYVWTPVNQFSGGQMEAVNATLPTFFFGPHLPAADHIYSLSTALNSQVSGNYQSNPILTSTFQEGMLTPVSLKSIAKLMTVFPREIVLYALIQSITITRIPSNISTTFINDPVQNYIQRPQQQIDPNDLSQIKNEECESMAYHNSYVQNFSNGYNCTYAKFEDFLTYLMEEGLSVELVSQKNPSTAASPQQGQSAQASAASNLVGKFCFLPGSAASSIQGSGLSTLKDWICATSDGQSGSDDGTTPAPKLTVTQVVTKKTATGTEITTTETPEQTSSRKKAVYVKIEGVNVLLDFNIRSPAQFLSYLGLWLRYANVVETPRYRTLTAQRVLGNQRYLDIVSGTNSGGCYSAVTFESAGYCVPQGATHTAMLMDLAMVLRNLNISPSDLNAPVTVRLSQ